MLIPWLNKPFFLPLQPGFPRFCSTWHRDTVALESFSHTLLKVNNNNSDWSHQIFALHLCHRALIEHLLFPLLPLSLFAKMFAKSSEFQRRTFYFPFPSDFGSLPQTIPGWVLPPGPSEQLWWGCVTTLMWLAPSVTSLHLKLKKKKPLNELLLCCPSWHRSRAGSEHSSIQFSPNFKFQILTTLNHLIPGLNQLSHSNPDSQHPSLQGEGEGGEATSACGFVLFQLLPRRGHRAVQELCWTSSSGNQHLFILGLSTISVCLDPLGLTFLRSLQMHRTLHQRFFNLQSFNSLHL